MFTQIIHTTPSHAIVITLTATLITRKIGPEPPTFSSTDAPFLFHTVLVRLQNTTMLVLHCVYNLNSAC